MLALCMVAAPAAAQVQQVLPLAIANTASAPQAVYGGVYILNQVCASYGTVTFQALGPDGSTYQTVATYSAATATGGVEVKLGTRQVVMVTLAGTTGCFVKLARVPA